MWNLFLLLFLSGPLRHSLTRADTADDLLLTEAVQLLQIDVVQRLETSLKEREQEVESTRAELENTKEILEGKLEKSWTLVRFTMNVLKKSQVAAKAREELVATQAAMLKQLKEELDECKANIGESLKMVNDSQEVIQGQRKTIEDLKSVVVGDSSLNATYQEIKEANLLKTNCDVPTYLSAITQALTAQQDEIDQLKQTISGKNNVTDLLTGISKAAIQGAMIVQGEPGNWEVLEECQDVLEKQSSSLHLLRTLASERVTRNNSLHFSRDHDGHIVSASFCQCIPNPSHLYTKEVSLTLVRDSYSYFRSGWDPWWSLAWSPWQSENCNPMTLSNGTTTWVGEGSRTRRRLKDLNARHWEDEVEEIACLNTVPNARCFEYNELKSSQRKTTEGYHQGSCDGGSEDRTRDWKGPGWYRITGEAGTKLIESQVDINHCGTKFGGWLSGGHPTVEQGEVSRTINFNNYPDFTNQAKVINCGTHYVYHLDNVPACNAGYCTE